MTFLWYRSKLEDFPKLSQIARALLCIPASSIDSERLFSKATQLFSNKLRNRLGGQRAQEVLLIKSSLSKIELGPPVKKSDDEVVVSDSEA
jgi:hypothetical protein